MRTHVCGNARAHLREHWVRRKKEEAPTEEIRGVRAPSRSAVAGGGEESEKSWTARALWKKVRLLLKKRKDKRKVRENSADPEARAERGAEGQKERRKCERALLTGSAFAR